MSRWAKKPQNNETSKNSLMLDEILGHQSASAPAFLVDTGSPTNGTTTAQLQESDADGETDGKGEHIYKEWMIFTSTNVKLQIQAMCRSYLL